MRQAVEDLVTDDVSEFIVYALKVVDVEDHIGGTGAFGKDHFDRLRQIGTVPKTCHRVFGGDALKALRALFGKTAELFKFERSGNTRAHDLRDKRFGDKVGGTEF